MWKHQKSSVFLRGYKKNIGDMKCAKIEFALIKKIKRRKVNIDLTKMFTKWMVSIIPEINWIIRYFSFISNAFFQLGLSVANLFMNWGSKRCLMHNKHYHTETGFIIMSVSMSRPKSIYVVYMWSIFLFYLHFHYD